MTSERDSNFFWSQNARTCTCRNLKNCFVRLILTFKNNSKWIPETFILSLLIVTWLIIKTFLIILDDPYKKLRILCLTQTSEVYTNMTYGVVHMQRQNWCSSWQLQEWPLSLLVISENDIPFSDINQKQDSSSTVRSIQPADTVQQTLNYVDGQNGWII